MFFAPPLAAFAIRFGPPEYSSLAVMSLTLVTYLSKGSLVKSLMMACVGVIISTAGMDPITSRTRFTFGLPALLDGFEIVFAIVFHDVKLYQNSFLFSRFFLVSLFLLRRSRIQIAPIFNRKMSISKNRVVAKTIGLAASESGD